MRNQRSTPHLPTISKWYSLPATRSASHVSRATSSLRQLDHRKTLAAAAPTGTLAHCASKKVNSDSSSSPSKCLIGRLVPSIHWNWFHGLASSSLSSSTTPRTHLRPALRLARSNAACNMRDHLSTVFGLRHSTSLRLFGYCLRQFLGN